MLRVKSNNLIGWLAHVQNIGPSQRSRFLVLIKGSAAYKDENGVFKVSLAEIRLGTSLEISIESNALQSLAFFLVIEIYNK